MICCVLWARREIVQHRGKIQSSSAFAIKETTYKTLVRSRIFCGRKLTILSFEDTYKTIYYQYERTKICSVIDVFSKKDPNKKFYTECSLLGRNIWILLKETYKYSPVISALI